jgi:hypothetical protein
MKRFPILLVAAMLVAAVPATAQEHHGRRTAREPVVHAPAPHPVYRGPQHGYCGLERFPVHQVPVRCAPVYVMPRGHWETVAEQVLVEPGHWCEQYVAPTFGWTIDICGLRIWGVIAPGGYQRVWCPPRYETFYRRVWVRC